MCLTCRLVQNLTTNIIYLVMSIGNTNQLKAGAALNYIVIILNIFVALFYTPYMLRMMGQNEYGLYAIVSSVIGYLTVLQLGIGNAIVR